MPYEPKIRPANELHRKEGRAIERSQNLSVMAESALPPMKYIDTK